MNIYDEQDSVVPKVRSWVPQAAPLVSTGLRLHLRPQLSLGSRMALPVPVYMAENQWAKQEKPAGW